MKKKLLFLALCCLPLVVSAQNKIDRSKSNLNSGSSSAGNTTTTIRSSDDNYDDDSESTLGGMLLGAMAQAMVFVTWKTAVGSYAHEPHLRDNALTHYPFQYPETGNYIRPEYDSIYREDPFRFEIKDKFLYSYSSLYGNHANAKIRPFRYFYFSADYYQLHETQEAKGTSDNLSLFYFNFAYDRVRLQRFNLGWTAGASYIPDVDRGGFSVGINGEYFLKKKVSFMAAAKWSWVNYQPVHAYEAEARWHKKNFYLTAGFEHLRIAGPQYNFITLGGGIHF